MTPAPWRRYAAVLSLLIAGVVDVSAGTFTLFGPRTFTRGTGAPVVERVTFQAPSTSGYVLHVESDGVASAVVTLNGNVVLAPRDFRPAVTTLQRPVTLTRSNVLTVELRSAPGTWLRIRIVGTDNDAPAITATAVPAPNAAGWNNGPVTVTFTCSDAISGIAQCPDPVAVSGEGAGQIVSGEAVDLAGNRAAASVSLNIDRTAPTIAANVSPAANADGWHSSDVTVSFACADALSGVAECAGPVVVGGSGVGLPAAGTATDLAGNTATAAISLNIDRTAPVISARLSAPANAAGWHVAPVTVEFDCADAGSGVAACPAPVLVAGEGAGQVVRGIARDRAGNLAEASVTINLDLTAPRIVATLSEPANEAGWHRDGVTVSFTCHDEVSGVVECPAPRAVSDEGIHTVAVTVADRAGLAGAASIEVRVDRTPPTIVASVAPAPNASGWHRAPVAVTFACADSGSGVADCTPPVTVAAEGPDQSVPGAVTDRAGNRAETEARVSLDLTPPTIRAIVSASGPSNSNVTVAFECADALSGVAACPEPVTIVDEGLDQLVEGVAIDNAGNSSRATASVSIDRTKPTIAASVAPAPNAAGWHSVPEVVVSFTCADTGSGVVACPEPVIVTAEGAAQTVSRTVSDRAGNTATATVEVSLDLTPPVIAGESPVPGWTNAPQVIVRFVCTDALSGIDYCNDPIVVTAEGAHQILGAARDRAGNGASAAVTVQIDRTPPIVQAAADRAPNAAGWHNAPVVVSFTCADTASGVASCPADVVVDNGRDLVVSGAAIDRAGNSATASLTVNVDTVPPVIRAIATPGWSSGDVVVSFQCTDDEGSGVASCPAQVVVTADGATTVRGEATDVAGNRASVETTVQVDRTPPTILARVSGVPNAQGWHTSAVRVEFECADALSGVQVCPAPVDVATSGGGQVVTGTAIDEAGNRATATVTLNVDLAPPSIVALVTPAGTWANGPVTVTFACSDAASGVATCPAPVTVTAEGAAQAVSGTATDVAGNTASTSVSVNIDLTAPAVAISSPPAGSVLREPAAAIAGTVQDTLSGVLSVTCAGAPAVVTSDGFLCGAPLTAGANTIEVVAVDRAGNLARSTLALTFNSNSTPVARAGGPYSGETGAAIRFDGSQSSDAEGQPLSFAWAFGNGATATGMSPSVTFATAGSFAVELTVTDSEGASSSSTTTVTVTLANRVPVANAGGPYSGDAAQTITFSAAASSDPDGDPLGYTWSFGDGTTASGAVVRRAYTTPGTYTARVTVEDGRGGTDTATAQVTVRSINQRPTAQVGGPYGGETGTPVQFAGSGTDPDNDPLTYTWTFSDGGTATGASAAHVFTAPGTFTATLTVSDGRGGTHAASTQLLIAPANRAPLARLDAPASGDAGRPVAFSAAGSTDPDEDPMTFSWSFGDGRSATGTAPVHTFEEPGTYNVSVTVFDSRGASSAATASITIAPRPAANQPPVANAGGPYVGEAGLPMTFSAAGTTDPDGDALTFSWDFGNGQSATGVAPVFAYAEPGAYTVTLTVTDARGGTHSAAVSATVGAQADRAPPVVALQGPRHVLPGTRVRITADASDNVAVVSVTFESGGTTYDPILAAPYVHEVTVPAVGAPGETIPVRATARDASGNAAAAVISLTITAEPDNEAPTVALQAPASTSPGSTVRISAAATDNDGVASVTFSVAGVVIAVDAQAPYEAAYAVPADLAIGSVLQVSAQAVDHTGNRASTAAAIGIAETSDAIPPVVQLTAPASVLPGGTISLAANVTDNTGVAAVIFSVDGTRVATVTSAPYTASHAVSADAVPGTLFRAEARAIDFAGLEAADVRHTQVAAAGVTEAFIVGEVYDDATGLPLGGATVTMSGGATGSVVADVRGRFASAAGTGEVVVQIERDGYTRVERRVVAAPGVRELVDARLTPLAAGVPVTPVLGTELRAGAGALALSAGSLPAVQSISFTAVGAQGLVGLLPMGWSPVAAFDIAPHGIALGVPAALRVAVPAGDVGLTLAAWDTREGAWRAVASAAAGSPTLEATVETTGQFAWIRPDVLPVAPPQPVAGAIVTGVPSADVPEDATTAIVPAPRVIFYQPGARSVVQGALTTPTPLPSGTRLWARISESYRFFSGASMYPDPATQDIFLYQSQADGLRLGAGFAATPSQMFEALTLERGVIGIELYVPADTATPGAVISRSGGTVSLATGERLAFPENAIAGAAVASLQRLSLDQLGVPLPEDLEFLGAVDVAISGAAVERGGVLSIARPSSLSDEAQVLLVRLATLQGRTRLVLVAIGRVDGDRLVAEPVLPLNRTEMEGVRTSGRYVFVRPMQPVGFVAGQVLGAGGGAVAGAQVSTETLPIVALSRASGTYVAAAVLSTVTLTALQLDTADRGTGSVVLATPRQEAALDLRLVAEPPRVTFATPAAGATGVPQSTAVVIIFSEPVAADSLGSNVVLAAGAVPVEGAVSLSAGNTVLTFRPAAALDPDTQYTFTLAAGITDVTALPMGAPFVLTFTTLDTTPPPPPAAGTLSASIPENGSTTVRGAQGTAGLHDAVSIENVTRGTSTPVLLDPNGGFLAIVQASAGDRLRLRIVDASGNETLVEVPAFARQNADGSISAVVGSGGGRIDGPDGTAVDVPEGSLPDGTIVTVKSVAEGAFPVQLSAEEKTVFGFAGGVQLDFGGVTPNRYVNISVAPASGDTADDQWIVARAIDVAGQQVLNAVDTAKLIDGRVRTSSPPCPGVLAAGTYGIYKSSQPVGLAWGRMYAFGSYDGLRFSVGVVPSLAGFALPFPVYAWENPAPICLPVLTGRVTVGPNTTRFRLEPGALNASDREIVIRNVTAGGRESHFRRELLEYAFEVPGSGRDNFAATIVSTSGQQTEAASVAVRPGPPGTVIVSLDADAIDVSVARVIVRNTSVNPVAVHEFTIDELAFELTAGGGLDDFYWMTAIDADGVSRRIEPQFYEKLPSAHGPGNLLAKALVGTIDPTLAEYQQANPGAPAPPKYRTGVELITFAPQTNQEVGRVTIPAERIVNGGFHFAFEGEDAFDYGVEVLYNTGERDFVRIHRLRLIVSNPQTGRVIKTIEVPAPARDEPLGIGPITNDGQPPLLTASPLRLNSFDPATPLTFSFSESMDADSIRQNALVRTAGGQPVAGVWRVYDRNRTATFVPNAPLRIGEEYSITFVGGDALGQEIAPGVQAVTDLGGNAIATMRLQVKTFKPRVVASVQQGADGRPMDEIYDIQIRRVRENDTSKTYLFATTNAWDDGPKFLVFDATKAEDTREAGSAYGGRFQKKLTLVTDIGLNGNAPLMFREPQPGPTPECGPVGPAYTGDLAVSAVHNVDFSFVQVWHPGAPELNTDGQVVFRPCLLTSKLLTANPDTLNTYTRPGTIHAIGFAQAVATIRHETGIAAFTAVRDVGLFATDIGAQIPTPFPADRKKDAFSSGDYFDVVAFQDRLLAANNTGKSLDILDPNLAQLGSVALPGGARHIAVAENYGVDEDGDGFIRPNEVRNLAFVATRDCPGGPACSYTVQIVDLKTFSNPEVIGFIQMPGFVSSLDIDPAKHRLFATGYTNQTQAASAFFMIDISRPTAFAADADQDGLDDRIIWKKEFPSFLNSARIDKERGLAYIPVAAEYGARKGRLEIWAIYDNCCDLAVDFDARPAERQAGNREGLLRKEREALREGIRKGLAEATTTCGVNPATLTILEQGSGACLWRGRCDDNYQPGLSDHDFEVFIPLASWNVTTSGGKSVAKCTADVLTETFVDPVTGEPKKIALPNGDAMAFEDITFFAEVRERFESATFDVERPESSGSDATGDMGLGRRSLLLKWLLEGAYVTGIDGYNVEGRSLGAILADLRNVTRIPRLEGHEWSVLQEFNLAKSKAFLRIAGASNPNSAFHKLFVKQLHDAGKAGIRATMARLVADATANTMVLDVTREQFDTSACYDIIESVTNPRDWRQKPCTSFEEYVASAAARTLRENLGLFTFDEVVRQAHRFYRVKSDRERIVSEQKADAFIALVAAFITNAKTLTQGIYNQTLPSDPDAAARTQNMGLAQGALGGVLRQAKLPLSPHVFSRGFKNGTGLRVAMYRADTAGAGSLEKEIRVDLAGGDDRYLSYVRNPDGTLALVNGKATPIFQLSADLTQGFGQVRGVSFVIDLPDRTMKESNRQNNVGGFFYYVLDRATGATPAVPARPHVPLGDESVLDPSPECYDSPTLMTTQRLWVGGEDIGDQVVLGRGESVTIRITVQNMSGESVDGVLGCSNITNQCYEIGTLQAGESRTIQVEYVTPDEDTYIDGTPSAFSPETGVLTGGPIRVVVNGDAYSIQPLMDEAIVGEIDPDLLNVQAGGRVLRHYRIVGKRSGQPKPNMTVTAELEGFFGSQVQKQLLTFSTNAKGEICTPGGSGCTANSRGIEIPYQSSMITGTSYTLTLQQVDGVDIGPENHTRFTFDAQDRPYSQSYAVGGQIGFGVKIIGGVDFDEEDGFEISRSGGFFNGPKELGLSLSRQYTFKRKAEAKLSLAFKTPVIAATAEVKTGVSTSAPVSFTDTFVFPYVPNADPRPGQPPFILEFDAHCAIATVTTTQLARNNPAVAKLADLLREQPCGDPNKFAKSHAVKGSYSLTGSAGLEIGLQSPLLGRIGNQRPTLGINAGLSATGSVSLEHETSVEWTAAGESQPSGYKTAIGLFGQMELSGSVGLSLRDTFRVKKNGIQPSEEEEREDFFAMESIKKALTLSGSRSIGGSFGLDIEQDRNGVVDKVSISFAQPKTWGWNAAAGGGGAGVNGGQGFGRSIKFTLTRTDDKVRVLEKIANLQQLANAIAEDGSESSLLTLTPTKIDDEVLGLRAVLFDTVSAYEISQVEGSGFELPFAFEGQLAKVGLSAALAFKGDSKMSWVAERGTNYKGRMLPLQTYTKDDYLPAQELGLSNFIAQMWESVNASFGPAYSYMSANVTPDAPAVVVRSPNTAIMTIDGTREPEPFEATLYSYKYREIAGPVAEAPRLPIDTSGPAGLPHYGVGGFHHFGPDMRLLGAPAHLVIDYQDAEIAGLDESTFAIYGWNSETSQWEHVGGVVDAEANTVTASVDRLRLYTVAPAMPAGTVTMTAVADAPSGTGETATQRFVVTTDPLVMNNGGPVPEGTLFTVRSAVGGASDESPFGTILTPDADGTREHTQVRVVNGRLQFEVELATPSGVFIPARVTVHAPGGTAYGEVMLTKGAAQ